MSAWEIRDKTVLITGGNAGIGLETARELARRGGKVTIACRDTGRGEQARADLASSGAEVELEALDLASFASIHAFAERYTARHEPLHVLVNNAGLILDERRETAEGFEMTLGVNHIGHALLTRLLLPRVRDSTPARIINLASSAHMTVLRGPDWARVHDRGRRFIPWRAYAESKLANILYTRALAKRLAGSGVSVFAVHPGVVRTHFGQADDLHGVRRSVIGLVRPFMRTARGGAATSIHVATAPDMDAYSGRYFARSRLAWSTPVSRDDANAEALWTQTEAWLDAGGPG